MVSVAERSDDCRSLTTKSKASEACWGLLRITTHIQKDDVGVQMNISTINIFYFSKVCKDIKSIGVI